jgi:BON domain-containing protein
MRRVIWAASAAVIAVVVTAAAAPPDNTTGGLQDTTKKVRHALERMPYYGVYDFLAFKVEPGVITLQGYAHRPSLRNEAETMVKHATGADIVNKIEILPTSSFDDRIRWSMFQQIYTDELADRYVAGGAMETRYELLTMTRFPGMEPFGTYPVHIIVKNRRVALIGVVISDVDKAQILVRAGQVPHTLAVEDAITVRAGR